MTPQELKNSILQLAIQGKLVEQRPEEGTAEDLYKQIQAEKAKLIREGKIKTEKPLPEMTEEEMPFEVPESWKWVRLGNVTFNWGQKQPENRFCYVDVGSVDNQKHALNDNETVVEASDASSRARKVVKYGDVIFATIRPYLQNICIIDRDFTYEPIVSTAFAVMHCPEGLFNKYLYYYLFSPSFMSFANATDKAKGVAYPAIGEKDFYNGLVPLPPLVEQKRIVAKIEELQPLIDRYEQAYTKLEDFNNRFPSDMQKSILQIAIQGKLVPQDLSEGTGEELYKQIQAEKAKLIREGKIKKGKPLPEIAEDEIPFEIPESWKWVRFSNIAAFINGDRGANYPNRDEYVSDGVAWINTGHITSDGYLDVLTMNYITEEKYDSLRSGKIEPGDLVYCLRGATFGKTARIEPYTRGAVASSLMIIRLFYTELREYIYIYLKSPMAYLQLHLYNNGSAQPNLGARDVEKYLIPLPPLAEQKRIVAKIEELRPLCERLKKC